LRINAWRDHRHGNNPNISRRWVSTRQVAQFRSVEYGHHDVEKEDVGLMVVSESQSDIPGCTREDEPFICKGVWQEPTKMRIIFKGEQDRILMWAPRHLSPDSGNETERRRDADESGRR
jgi:hypothetical protein